MFAVARKRSVRGQQYLGDNATFMSAVNHPHPDAASSHVRHPQYVGFALVMFGFLLQWPTLLTLAMFPVLIWMYVYGFARSQERDAIATFGDSYRRYAARVPAFMPRSLRPADVQSS